MQDSERLSGLPFVTVCTTCQARLKVRDEAAVGLILACPKCGSMVLIEGPEGAAEGSTEGRIDDTDQAAGVLGGPTDAELAAALDESAVTDPAVPPADSSRQPNWTSAPAAPQASWIGITVGVTVGAMLALGLVAYVLTRATNQSGTSVTVGAKPGVALDDTAPNPLVKPEEVIQRDQVPDDVSAAERSASLLPESPRPEEETTPIANDPPMVSTSDYVAPSRSKRPLPPDLLVADDPVASPHPRMLSDLANLLEGAPHPATDQTEDAERSSSVKESSNAPSSPPTARSSPSQDGPGQQLAAYLGWKVRSVAFKDVPLIDFLRAMMQLSAVPIQLDPAALRQSGKGARSPVTFAAQDISVDEVLRRALQPLKLTPVVEDHVVRISSPIWESQELKQIRFFVGDLQQGRGHELNLASVIPELIEPESWSRSGGAGTIDLAGDRLEIRQTRRVHFQLLLLLEKLRLARGLEPRSKIPLRYLPLEPRWARLGPRLNRRINLDVWHPLPIAQIVSQLEEASGLRILVDWQAVAEVAWTADTERTLAARKATVAEVLAQLLSSAELELRPIQETTVQITTMQANAARPYLEFYTLQQLGETGLARLEEAPAGTFVLDPASETVLVVLPASEHRALVGY